MRKRVHFIAIGGAAMHNLAIALHKKGYLVTGSDDEIFEPSRGRLKHHGILPEQFGWFPDKINKEIDAVILGMHARIDNPELIKAKELGVTIYSYPEFLYEQTKNKKRIVIGGSHGKTTTTAMVMHVLKDLQYNFDYMVGSQIDGFDTMVKLSDNADIAVFEGDEYLSSPIDKRPKFHLYNPHIALITGIAWDHINVFPTFEIYKRQFEEFIKKIEDDGTLIWYKNDDNLKKMVLNSTRNDISDIPYDTPEYIIENGVTIVDIEGERYQLKIFGEHNLQNMEGAAQICFSLGINSGEFYRSMQRFEGAARRLQKLEDSGDRVVYYDFAHSPSKLKATVEAVKNQYKDHRVVACMELHTFSSLNHEFLNQYNKTMNVADDAVVFFNPETVKHKKLKNISTEDVFNAFGRKDLQVFSDRNMMVEKLKSEKNKKCVFLLMSSGNFSGVDIKELAKTLV